MKLRNVDTIDKSLLEKGRAVPSEHHPEKNQRNGWLLPLLLGLFVLETVFLFIRYPHQMQADFFQSCWQAFQQYVIIRARDLLDRPLWQKILFFAPALAFDVARYYLTNTIAFLQAVSEVFTKRQVPEEFQKDEPPLVTMVIPVYNEGIDLKETLDTVLENDYPRKEVVVVDDHSQDSTPQICREYERKGKIRYFRHSSRQGKPAALNYGRKMAQGSFIGHMDGDVVLRRDSIRKALYKFTSGDVSAVCGNLKVRNDTQSPASRMQAVEYGMVISLQRRWLSMRNALSVISGAFGIFRRQALERNMGTDPETGEDLDIGLKIRKSGGRIKFAADAVALTSVPETFTGVFRQRVRWDECYIRLNVRKHGDLSSISSFGYGEFRLFISDFFFNVVLLLVFPLYIIFLAVFFPHLLGLIVLGTYIFYTLMNFYQFTLICLTSDTTLRDSVFLLYAPLYFFYTLFLKAERLTAYFLETFRMEQLRDGHFPPEVWDNLPRY